MSRFACLAPARSYDMKAHQQRLLEVFPDACLARSRAARKRHKAEDQLLRAAFTLERSCPPASAAARGRARRALADSFERRGRRGGQQVSKEQRQSRALEAAAGPAFVRRHMGRHIRRTRREGARQAAERAAVVGAAYRIHGAAAIADRTTAAILDQTFLQTKC